MQNSIPKKIFLLSGICVCAALFSGCGDSSPLRTGNGFESQSETVSLILSEQETGFETEAVTETASEAHSGLHEDTLGSFLSTEEAFSGSTSVLTLSSGQKTDSLSPEKLWNHLILCRHAFGSDFTFAMKINEDPSAEWERILENRRSIANSPHYRTLISLYRIEDLRFPRPERSPEMLQRKLQSMTSRYEGIWSVYTKDLFTNEETVIHDTPMKSASVMKLFVMAAVYQAVADGELERTSELVSRISAMISLSSNDDANQLLSLLGGGDYARGIEKVNKYLTDHGYSHKTHEFNGFQNEATIMDNHHFNLIAACDCARLLEQIYHREFGSYLVCSEIEKFMLAQQTRGKIPAGISRVKSDVLVGNKTGEMNHVENDAAIVYSPKCDYIVCIFSNGWSEKETAIEQIRTLSEEIYRYYNDES